MVTVNLNIQNYVNNGQKGNINHIEFAKDGVQKVYRKCSDKQAGLKTKRSCYL